MDVDFEALQCIHNILTIGIFVVFGLICILVNKCCNVSLMRGGKNSNCTCKKTVYQGEITPSNNFLIQTPGQAPYKVPFYKFLEQSTYDNNGAANGYRSASCEKCCNMNSGNNDSCTSTDQIVVLQKAKFDVSETEPESSRVSLSTQESIEDQPPPSLMVVEDNPSAKPVKEQVSETITEHTISVKVKYFDNHYEGADSEVSRDDSDLAFDEQGSDDDGKLSEARGVNQVIKNQNKNYVAPYQPERNLYTQKQSASTLVQPSNSEASHGYDTRQNIYDERQITPNKLTLKVKPTRDVSALIKKAAASETSKAQIEQIPAKTDKNRGATQHLDNKDRTKPERDSVNQRFVTAPAQKYNVPTAEQDVSSLKKDNHSGSSEQDTISYGRGVRRKDYNDKPNRFEHKSPDNSNRKNGSPVRLSNEDKTKLPEPRRDSSSRGRARGIVPRENENESVRPGSKLIMPVKPMPRIESPTRLTTNDEQDKRDSFAKYSSPLRHSKNEMNGTRLAPDIKTTPKSKIVVPVKPMIRDKTSERKTTSPVNPEDKTAQQAEIQRRVEEKDQDKLHQPTDKHVVSVIVKRNEDTPTKIVLEDLIEQEPSRESITVSRDYARTLSQRSNPIISIQEDEKSGRLSLREIQEENSPRPTLDRLFASPEKINGLPSQTITMEMEDDTSHGIATKNLINVKVRSRGESPVRIVLEDVVTLPETVHNEPSRRSEAVQGKVEVKQTIRNSRSRTPSPKRLTLDELFTLPRADCGIISESTTRPSLETKITSPKMERDIPSREKNKSSSSNKASTDSAKRNKSPARIISRDKTVESDDEHVFPSRPKNIKKHDEKSVLSDMILREPNEDGILYFKKQDEESNISMTPLRKKISPIYRKSKENTTSSKTEQGRLSQNKDVPLRGRKRTYDADSTSEDVSPKKKNLTSSTKESLSTTETSDDDIKRKHWSRSRTRKTANGTKYIPSKLKHKKTSNETSLDICRDICARLNEKLHNKKIPNKSQPDSSDSSSSDSSDDNKDSLDRIIRRNTEDNGYTCDSECDELSDSERNSPQLGIQSKISPCMPCKKLVGNKVDETDFKDASYSRLRQDYKRNYDKYMQSRKMPLIKKKSVPQKPANVKSTKYRVRTKSASPEDKLNIYKVSPKLTIASRGKTSIENLTNIDIETRPLLRIRINNEDDEQNVTCPRIRKAVETCALKSKCLEKPCTKDAGTGGSPGESVKEYLDRIRREHIIPNTPLALKLNNQEHLNSQPSTSTITEEDISDIMAKYQPSKNETKSINRTCPVREKCLRYPRQKSIESEAVFRYNTPKSPTYQQTYCPQFYPYRNYTARRPVTYSQPAVISSHNCPRRRPVHSACSSRTPYCSPLDFPPKQLTRNLCIISSQAPPCGYNYCRKPVKFCNPNEVLPTPRRSSKYYERI